MRKFYLFLAGAFLALPLVAQNEPIRNPQTDPKFIYEQNFEDDFDAWSTSVVDTIDGLDYFKTTDKSTSNVKIWENKEYQNGFIHRDTLINIYHGVKQTGNKTDIAEGAFDKDDYTIRTDAQDDLSRQKALDEYGTNGGKKYFQYYATDGSKAVNAMSGLVPEYRRNLFVRLPPGAIEENSSYRITMYMKTTKLENEEGVKNTTKATFRAELMRGFFDSEKNFSMGRDVSSSKTFTYEKNDFIDGEWTKLTYMSYFLTNEIAEQFCYYNGFHSDWQTAWEWKNKALTGYESLNIIRQPNKFFLRMSFRGDSTIYDLDNISIIKSYIGGIQHAGNLIRVDFGYQTNLKDQALAAKERTNIPAVELPGQFFTVRGYKASTNKWQKIGISTAEYHDDGYLYMWAKPGAGGATLKFESYDSVLVSFTNPTGVEYETLALKYNTDLYPNALDEAWVNAGKRVLDFTNEVSTPNPNIAKGVYQMKNLPPVMHPNGAPYENGSFGLPGTLDSIRLVLSRKIEFDANETEGSGEKAFMKVYKDGVLKEIWPVSQSTDTWTTFKRQGKDKGTPLSGDYTFEVVQMKGVGDANYSTFEIKLDYSFGDFDKNIILREYASDWRHEKYSVDLKSGSRYYPESIYVHSNQDPFTKGTGGASAGKCGLYPIGTDDGYIYISNRNKENSGNLYSIETIEAGDYNFSFKAFTWNGSADRSFDVYIYPKPSGEITFELFESAEKTLFHQEFKPSMAGMSSSSWPSGTETFTYPVTIPTTGDYVIEWVDRKGSQNSAGSYRGVCIGNYSVKTRADNLSANYVSMVNGALKRAEEKKAFVDAAERKYKGDAYTAMTTIAANVKASIFNETAPGKYEAAATSIDDAIKAMQVRMDTVDLFYTAMDTVNKILAANTAYSTAEAYTKLNGLKTKYASYDCSQYTSKQISETADILNAAVDTLNQRVKYSTRYVALLDSTKKILDSTFVIFKDPKLEGKDLFEYDTLNQVYEAAKAKKDAVNSLSDEEFFNYTAGMESLLKAYLAAPGRVLVTTNQTRELYAFAADSLGYDFGGKKDSIKSLIYDLRSNSRPELEEILRQAIILQIYKKYAEGETVGFGAKDTKGADSVDLSVLIPNYYLANNGEADVNMESKSDVWVVKAISGGNKTAIPGWTFKEIGGTNGYWLPTTSKVGAGDGHDWAGPSISGLRCGPQTSGTIVLTDSVDIPSCLYFFGLEGYNQTSNVALELVSDSAKIGTGDKTSLNTVWNPGGGKFKYGTAGKPNVGKDSIKIAGKTMITIKQTSGSGSEFDMRRFYLILRGKNPKVNYAALARAQEAKLADMITFVAPVAVAAEPIAVQYYNLNGVRVLAPEAGKVVIKRTILSNGKSVAEKILVK